MIIYLSVWLALLRVCFSSLDLQDVGDVGKAGEQRGWLDRVVLYYKDKFYEDVIRTLPDVEIKAEIQPASAADEQHDAVWDESSVLRLAELLRRSNSAPLRRLMQELDEETEQLTRRRYIPLQPEQRRGARAKMEWARRARRGDRRLLMTPPTPETTTKHLWPVPPVPDQELWAINVPQSYLFFPRIEKNVEDYYDHPSADYDFVKKWSPDYGPMPTHVDPMKRIYIMNPVEAKLPGHYIRVGLLMTILKERALQSRMLPITGTSRTWPPISTRPQNNTTTTPKSNTTTNVTTTPSNTTANVTTTSSKTTGNVTSNKTANVTRNKTANVTSNKTANVTSNKKLPS